METKQLVLLNGEETSAQLFDESKEILVGVE